MKDIDFDELDKAVNSLMTPPADGVSEPKTEQAAFDKPRTPLEVPDFQKANNDAVPSSPEPVLASTNAVKRSSGRFMDVVHPSSDMRNATPVNTPARSSGITPPNRAKPLVTTPTQLVDAAVDKEPSPPAPVQQKPATTASFPDPLDMMPVTESEKKESAEVISPELETSPAEVETKAKDVIEPITDEPSDDSSETLESLFLPNVKVEKRPLGVANSADEEEATETPAFDAAEDTKNVDTLVTPDPTLAELGDDVLAIESDTSAPTEEEEAKNTDSVQPKKADDPISTNSALAGSAISSIPRQYSVKPSSDDKHHEALYDTAAQAGSPLQHPAKKKSGWMVVLWVLLLIVVGVGGALALYFMKVF